MKNLNKKGFTLIELLAVIVILAILVTVSVPAVTKYLASARKGTYSTNALSAIETIKNDYLFNGATGTKKYTLENINSLLDKKLINSPYGKKYDTSSYIQVTDNGTTITYAICLVDDSGNAIAKIVEGTPSTLTAVNENEIDTESNSTVLIGSGFTTCQ